VALVAMAPTAVAAVVVARTRAKTKARKNRPPQPHRANALHVRRASRSLARARRPAKRVLPSRLHRVLTARRTNFWMTRSTTSAIAPITSARIKARTSKVAIVALALQPQVPLRHHAVRHPVATAHVAARAPAPAMAQGHPANAAVRATVQVVMARRVVKTSRATAARLATISLPVKSQPFAALATVSRHRRSCTRSRKAIASRPPSCSINCQAAHAVKSQPC